jgi:hypothetical protein
MGTGGDMAALPREKSLAPELSLVDCEDDLLWHRDGQVTLVYRIEGLHEPGLEDEQLNGCAFAAENVVSGLPENTSYQFYVLVDHVRGLSLVDAAFPPLPENEAGLLEELRRGRVAALKRVEPGFSGLSFVQDRRHFLAASFRPQALRENGLWSRLGRSLRDLLPRSGSREARYEGALKSVLQEAATFDKRVSIALLQMGLGFARMPNPSLVSFVYELLNPSSAPTCGLETLPRGCRGDREGAPRTLVEELPFLGETSPVYALVDDDVLVRRDHLLLGDFFTSVITLKQLPDRTEPGLLVPLLRLGRRKYGLVYRMDVPRTSAELAALRAKATLAAGLRLENFLVKSDRADPVARAVQRQSDEALERIIASSQRVLGTSLQLVLYEESRDTLEEAVEETLAVLSRAHGLRGYRETYLLKPAWLSSLPGAPALLERRRKALTPNAVDMLPVFDFRVGAGKVPFATPYNSVVLYDPFDIRCQANANILVTGTSGAGKSVLVQFLLSGYEMACAGRGEPRPYTVILDNGASYRRYIDLRPQDSRYVAFDFENPPGVDVFAWNAADGPLEEHVSRLEWLFLDLLRISEAQEERFEARKALLEKALLKMYRGGGKPGFASLEDALSESPEGRELAGGLFPFAEGTFRRLFRDGPSLLPKDGLRVICYDFKGLAEHRDLASIALRLVIFEVRRFSARVSRKSHRTFLVLDESWALLEGTGRLSATAAPFIAASVRMGRKEGTSVIGLSQQIEDFAQSSYGAAILGNSATKFVGMPGGESIEGLRTHLRLTDRQQEQVRRLGRTARFHEFLLIQGETSHVVRVPLDPLSRWIFTTTPRDQERLDELARSRPDLSLLERLRLLAGEP